MKTLAMKGALVKTLSGFTGVALAAALHAAEVHVGSSAREVPVSASVDEIASRGWTARFTVSLDGVKTGERLAEIPGAMALSLRMAGTDKDLRGYDERAGNYLNFKLADGTCPVIEAVIPGAAGRVGVPLGFLKNPAGTHEVTLNYTGAHWSLAVDGCVDDDMPFGRPVWPAKPVCRLRSPRVSAGTFATPAKKDALGEVPASRPVDKPIQFFTPTDHNAWVGDVATGWHKGRFHIFYLFDRRHHGSKGGRGGHYFAHLSSTDLANWVEHPLAVPIDEQWETLGTGTPFEFKGKYCLAYGLHTTRLYKPEEIAAKKIPIGATYSWSDDGIHFTKSGKIFHTSQNPSVYNRADGLLGLVSGYGGNDGLWLSDDLENWKIYDGKIPSAGDCGCAFEWKGWHYVIQGFTQFCASPSGKPGTYKDWVMTGEDIYEGMAVPMVSPFAGDRRIYAGWITHLNGWGGWLCLRELVSEPDGRLGTKWAPECVPQVPVSTLVAGGPVADLPPDGRMIFETNVDPAKGPAAVRLLRASGGQDLEFRIDPAARRAQFGDCGRDRPAPRSPTLREKYRELGKTGGTIAGGPNSAGSFAIENIRSLDKPFKIRLLVWYDPKSDATLVDAEIAGRRTMVCRRAGRFPQIKMDATETVVKIDCSREINRATPFLLGSCLEDLNHEVYGGLDNSCSANGSRNRRTMHSRLSSSPLTASGSPNRNSPIESALRTGRRS